MAPEPYSLRDVCAAEQRSSPSLSSGSRSNAPKSLKKWLAQHPVAWYRIATHALELGGGEKLLPECRRRGSGLDFLSIMARKRYISKKKAKELKIQEQNEKIKEKVIASYKVYLRWLLVGILPCLLLVPSYPAISS